MYACIALHFIVGFINTTFTHFSQPLYIRMGHQSVPVSPDLSSVLPGT